MSSALATAAVAGVVSAAASAHPRPPARHPTARQIAAAVRRAERSKSLWATINICDVRAHGNYQLGIRGQMPTLAFRAQLSMVIHVNYWSKARHRFVPIPSATTPVAVGTFSKGLQQDGVVFPFQRHAGLFNGTITYAWSMNGRKVGETTRRTTGGHPTADYGHPPHYSAAQCRIR